MSDYAMARRHEKAVTQEEMAATAGCFGVRLVPGCTNGCAEVYIASDTGRYFPLFRFDRSWLRDLAKAAEKAAAKHEAMSAP